MHNYTYISKNKIKTLYDQISNINGKEVTISGGGSLFAVKGESSFKTKITTTNQEKIDAIREQLKIEGSLGTLSSLRKKGFVLFSLPMYFCLDHGNKVAIWFTYDYDSEHETLYKIIMYGSPNNLVSRDCSFSGGSSNYDVLFKIMGSIIDNRYQEEKIRAIIEESDLYKRGFFHPYPKDLELTDLVDFAFDGLLSNYERDYSFIRHLGRVPNIRANCEILAIVHYWGIKKFDEISNIGIDSQINDRYSDRCKYIKYIVGSPLYVDSGQLIV